MRAPLVSALLLAALAAALPVRSRAGDFLGFTDQYCTTCHNDVDREGGLDLTKLELQSSDPESVTAWVRIHDRVRQGEMPPAAKPRPSGVEVSAFLQDLGGALRTVEAELAADGRNTRRRLNRTEYENAVRDLLHAPWLQLQGLLPEDGEAHFFDKVGAALDVSRVHLAQYLRAADAALREVIATEFFQRPTTTTRYYARENKSLISGDVSFRFQPFNGFQPDWLKFPLLGTQAQPDVRAARAPVTAGEANPAVREQEAIGWTSSDYIFFASAWSSFRVPVAGRYRLRFSGYTIWVGPGGHPTKLVGTGQNRTRVPQPASWYTPNFDDVSPGRGPEPVTIYSRTWDLKRRIGGIDLSTEPGVSELEGWLLPNEWVVTDASALFRAHRVPGSRGFTNPRARADGQPGVAFRWMEVEGPLRDETTGAGYRLLFDTLPVRAVADTEAGVDVPMVATVPVARRDAVIMGSDAGLYDSELTKQRVEVVSTAPRADAERLLRRFLARAYRQPVNEKEVGRFLGLIERQLERGTGFASAMLTGYTAVLASPAYVYLRESPGRLDDAALATRLALFLWNSEPDPALRARAARGELQDPAVLRAETERLLQDPKVDRFASAFLDRWLDLRRINENTPSTTLYPDYYVDDMLTEAAVAESQLYFTELLRRNLPARIVVDSDFTFLNERLAQHYGVPGVSGISMRRVDLPPDSPRGGFLTQASVLKVTANGTTTSPVIRGRWIMERILGRRLPPPPAVPAVEPDIRGAVTIRQQLDRHRADESCAVCHRIIDPPGFALENFDVLGGWRDRYRASSPEIPAAVGVGKNGWPFGFHYALPVDAAGQLPDGRAFRDIRDFKRLLLTDEPQLARNLVNQLVVYATGAPVRFSDRAAVEKILTTTADDGHGVRSLVHALVQSELFRMK
jgi:hypothetical protein